MVYEGKIEAVDEEVENETDFWQAASSPSLDKRTTFMPSYSRFETGKSAIDTSGEIRNGC